MKSMSTIGKWLQDPEIRQEYEATRKDYMLSILFYALLETDILGGNWRKR